MQLLGVSPDGRLAITTGEVKRANHLFLWSLQTSSIIRSWKCGRTGVTISFAIAPNLRYAVAGTTGGQVKVWDLKYDDATWTPIVNELRLSRVAIGRNSKFLGICSWQGVRVFDMGSRVLLATFSGHTAGVTSIEFSPDCKTLVSVSSDKTARIWNIETGVGRKVAWNNIELLGASFIAPEKGKDQEPNLLVLSKSKNRLSLALREGKTGMVMAKIERDVGALDDLGPNSLRMKEGIAAYLVASEEWENRGLEIGFVPPNSTGKLLHTTLGEEFAANDFVLSDIITQPAENRHLNIILSRIWNLFNFPVELQQEVRRLACLSGSRVTAWRPETQTLSFYHVETGEKIGQIKFSVPTRIMSDFEDDLEYLRELERQESQQWTNSNFRPPDNDDDEMEALRMMEEEERELKARADMQIFDAKENEPLRNDLMYDVKASEIAQRHLDKIMHSSSPVLPKEPPPQKWGHGFSSSPMGCTSPSFRCDQPTPMPSDWSIVNRKPNPIPASSPLRHHLSQKLGLPSSTQRTSATDFASSSPTKPGDDSQTLLFASRVQRSPTAALSFLESLMDSSPKFGGSKSPTRNKGPAAQLPVDSDEEPLFSDDEELTPNPKIAILKEGVSAKGKGRSLNHDLDELHYPESSEEDETQEELARRRENTRGKRRADPLESETLNENLTLPETQHIGVDFPDDDEVMLDVPSSSRARQSSNNSTAPNTSSRKRARPEETPNSTNRPAEIEGFRAISGKAAAEKRMRKELDELIQTVKINTEIKKVLTRTEQRKKDYSIIPKDTNVFLKAKMSNGDSLFFPFKKNRPREDVRQPEARYGGRRDLLPVNIHVMMRNIEEEKLRRMEDDTREMPSLFEEDDGAVVDAFKSKAKTLWVDKYAPKMYIDLVGDERLNREVLSWVKHWDFCVFKKITRSKVYIENTNGPSAKEVVDPLRRPEQKILLLAGPAGLGKTTLAHVVARHAGYNIIEINASDDRAGNNAIDRIINGIESKSIKSGKPNLVIIDEIDGAHNAAQSDNSMIKCLVDLCSNSVKKKEKEKGGDDDQGDDENEGTSGGSKKKKSARTLNRPIICICNDLYSPVLRPLRNVAKIINFKTPPFRILANRLSEICKWEGLTVDLRTLMYLCEMTDGDIRSSLNTLQFFRSRSSYLSYEMLVETKIGVKDLSRGLFKIWDAVFKQPTAKQLKKINAGPSEIGGANASKREHFNKLLSLIDACGEQDKLLQGCFDNYLKLNNISQADGNSKIEKALSWCIFYDKISSNGTFQYNSFPIVAFHTLFARVERPTIEYPKTEFEASQIQKTSESVVQTIHKGLSPLVRTFWGTTDRLVMELFSPLIQIVTPYINSVNIQAMKPKEKDVFYRIVNLMVTFGLKYLQEWMDSGQSVYRLEPPIDRLYSYAPTNISAGQGHTMFAVKQLISKEVALETIRRYESLRPAPAPAASQPSIFAAPQPNPDSIPMLPPQAEALLIDSLPDFAAKPSKEVTALDRMFGNRSGKIPDENKKPEKEFVIKKSVARDFFGRVIEKEVMSSAEQKAMNNTVRFRYSEGHSNAVKIPMRMKDLFYKTD
ncbi:hypothetical protein HDU97_001356 [Phlyctochytrium planicorne]|nr:hypothetical protein HDU97_001356 [Phlyctochytrium planicorne]